MGSEDVPDAYATDRARCYLLLAKPEEALRELTLLRDSCRMLEGAPTGRPTTLVAAMINVAITGLYVETFAEGVELRAWRAADFEAFQKQLERIDLCEQVANSFRDETVAVLHFLEHSPAETLGIPTISTDPPPSFWKRLREPLYVLTLVAPRGWVHQNMVTYYVKPM